jgi:UDP-N-acetylglucosamine 4,6-dehydratase
MLIDRITQPVLALPRVVKRAVAVALDGGLCVLTVWLAFSLRLGEWVSLSGYGWPAALGSVATALPIFAIFGLYRTVFRYVGWDSLSAIAQATLTYGVIYASVFTAFAVSGVPRTVGVIQPILLLIALVGTRALASYMLGGRLRHSLQRRIKRNVLIYGAGAAGRELAAALDGAPDMRVVGFVDDMRDLHGSVIGRVKVFAPSKIGAAVETLEVSEVFLAIPSVSQSRRNEILKLIRKSAVAVRTLPGLLDIADGKVTVSQLRSLDIADLLGRDMVAPDTGLMEQNIRNKVVVVTGAGGSIGSELCRQILALGPARLLMIDSSEYALYKVHRDLSRLETDAVKRGIELVPLLASVLDRVRLGKVFAAWRPQTIYHAAAYKHVPLVEHNPVEGVRNNVMGTLTCAQAARESGVENFVLVSTDKAVRPTNIMGASKRLAEMVLQGLAAEQPATCFSIVRFGNVLGSSGSVVPLFRQQISDGGPVTVTHREITRYFMTTSEAAQLVIQAGAMAHGGEVFVLDMGDPVRIADLARRMIELSGFKVKDDRDPDGDIEIQFTGLRPGEKLYEELLIGDNPTATTHARVMMANEGFLPLPQLLERLERLNAMIDDHDVWGIREILAELVSEYAPASEVVDWVFLKERQCPETVRSDPQTLSLES